jgi:hypothetical protein
MNYHIILSIISLAILGLAIYLYYIHNSSKSSEFFKNPFYISDPIDFNIEKINAIQDKCWHLRNTSEWKSCMYSQ